MGPTTKEVTSGGDGATGLSDDFIKNILGPLVAGHGGTNGGTPMGQTNGANPTGTTGLIGQNIAQLLGGTDVTDSIQKSIEARQTSDVANLRERYTASGAGSSAGTPAMQAETLYKAKAAPEVALAQAQYKSNTLFPLLQLLANISGKGIAQRETNVLAGPSLMSQIAQIISGGAQGTGSILAGVNAGKLPTPKV